MDTRVYRAYTVASDGHTKSKFRLVACETDQQAIECAPQHAKDLKPGLALEVWQGRRLVAEIKMTNSSLDAAQMNVARVGQILSCRQSVNACNSRR